MLTHGHVGTTDNFFKSINVRLDVGHPERFSHFHPTKNNVRIIRAVASGEPSPASIIVAAYGSGKSLAAGAAALLVRNDKASRPVVSEMTKRIGLVDHEIEVAFSKRARNGVRGLTIVLEGHEPDIANEVFRQAKEELSLLRRPRNHGNDVVRILEEIWKIARKKGRDHLAILWDEFGRHLEALASSGNAESLLLVQRMSEWATRKKSPTVSLSLILHQSFLQYADDLSQTGRSDWKKIEGRFDTIHYVEDSREIYELISSMVEKLGGVERGTSLRKLEKQAENALKLGLFAEFEDKHSLAEVLKRARPLHPLTLYALPRLAARLAQNERTVFSFVRDIALGGPTTFGDLYKYFSGSMAADTGVGGAYRRWLETESALSKANDETEREILSSVAVLGFGVSGERVRVTKKLLEFAVSGFQNLSKNRLGKTIEALIDRKLLLYRERNDDISVWHGTDIDIRGYLTEEIIRIESEFDPVDVLSIEYPAPHWRPVAHNVKNSIRRFFAGMYLPAGELLREGLSHPSLRLKPSEDGRVIYCLAETSEEISKLVSFAGSISSENLGVILVVPNRPARILGIALEIAALGKLQKSHDLIASDPFVLPELRHMTDSAREDLARVMTRLVRPGADARTWFSAGSPLLAEDDRELYEKLSDIADQRFPATPRINNELVVRHTISRPMVNARKKLVLGILEKYGEPDLGFDKEATTPDAAMYRTVLKRTDLYDFRDGEWLWASPEQLEDKSLAEVWNVFRGFFSDAGMEKSPSEELFDKLELPPYGMRRGVMPIFTAAGLQAFGRAVVIKREGRYLPDILASEIEEFCSNPEEFTVDVFEVDESLELYLCELIERFDGRRQAGRGDLIRQFYDALEFWKAQLPAQALKTRYVSDSARSFQSVLRREKNPAVIALKEFPKLAGKTGPSSGTVKFIVKLMQEIEEIVDGYAAKAISEANKVFNVIPGGNGNVLNGAKTWSMCFDDETFDPSELGSMCRAVLSRAREATSGRYTEASFVRALSSILIGRSFDRWDDSSPREFADGIRKVVEELERVAIESSSPSISLVPLLDGRFHIFYEQLARVLGPRAAAEKISELVREKTEKHTDPLEVKSDDAYGKSA